MPTKSEYSGFRLSRNGQARQVILMCHGGWTPHGEEELVGDGYTFVPKGIRLHFYTEHTLTSSGAKAAIAILNNAEDAYNGLVEQFREPTAPEGMSAAENDMFQQQMTRLRDNFFRDAVRCRESFGDSEKMVQIYNYGLSFELRVNEEAIWKKHQAGEYSSDVDLLMLTHSRVRSALGMERGLHLSDAFKAAEKLNEGRAYDVFHYVPCRRTEPGYWFSDLSHTG